MLLMSLSITLPSKALIRHMRLLGLGFSDLVYERSHSEAHTDVLQQQVSKSLCN